MAKYDITVQLTGTDGNAMSLIGTVRRALRTNGVSDDELTEFVDDAMSGDYNHVLSTCAEWVEVQ